MTCQRMSGVHIAAQATHNHPRRDLVQRLGEPILGLHQILGNLSRRQSRSPCLLSDLPHP
jgi:hypothetical protein